jgi:hypothetical protein
MSALSVALGVGLIGFWTWALALGGVTAAPEPWAGFRDHEVPFVVPDVALGLGLVVSGTWFPGLGPVCGGALVFLGLYDLAYLARTWGRRSTAMKVRTAVLGGVALGAGVAFAAVAPG